jgi:hypothetical protein
MDSEGMDSESRKGEERIIIGMKGRMEEGR